MKTDQHKRIMIAALLLAVCLLTVFCTPGAKHDCKEELCNICSAVLLGKQMLRFLPLALAWLAAALIHQLAMRSKEHFAAQKRAIITPITEKTRLLN